MTRSPSWASMQPPLLHRPPSGPLCGALTPGAPVPFAGSRSHGAPALLAGALTPSAPSPLACSVVPTPHGTVIAPSPLPSPVHFPPGAAMLPGPPVVAHGPLLHAAPLVPPSPSFASAAGPWPAPGPAQATGVVAPLPERFPLRWDTHSAGSDEQPLERSCPGSGRQLLQVSGLAGRAALKASRRAGQRAMSQLRKISGSLERYMEADTDSDDASTVAGSSVSAAPTNHTRLQGRRVVV